MNRSKANQVSILVAMATAFFFSLGLKVAAVETSTDPAVNQKRVRRFGAWSESRFRYAKTPSLQTVEEGAAIEFDFATSGIAVRLGAHNVPAYGPTNLGRLVVTIDGKHRRVLVPQALPREVLLADGLGRGKHTVRIEHQRNQDSAGCRIESFRSWDDPRGEVQFLVNGDENAHLVDCRATIWKGKRIIRRELVRNWLTGKCSLTGIIPGDGYELEVEAIGWVASRSKPFRVDPHQTIQLPPIYLKRDPATVIQRFRFPRLNQPAITLAGGEFRARFLGFDATIEEVKLTRNVGPVVISRVAGFEEDKSAAYYYDREVVVTLPPDMPAGAYDLAVKVRGGRRTGWCRSPRSVHVLRSFPTDPTFVTFGHLDTSGQHQAGYLSRLVQVINTLAPDMVLCSNACNPAYVSGALAGLDMPYVINFGNHQFPGHEAWYGDPVGLIDCGPHVSVLNFGYPWHTNTSKAESLLASRSKTAIRVINAFEANAPLSLLDRFQVRMIHDAHGIGKKVANFGSTPTKRVGKSNSESFRVVRFANGQVTTCTYNGHETAPIPFARESLTPIRVKFRHANDGASASNTATITNQLAEAYPNARVTFVLPKGDYGADSIQGGRLESQILGDDGRLLLLSVRVDIPAEGDMSVSVRGD